LFVCLIVSLCGQNEGELDVRNGFAAALAMAAALLGRVCVLELPPLVLALLVGELQLLLRVVVFSIMVARNAARNTHTKLLLLPLPPPPPQRCSALHTQTRAHHQHCIGLALTAIPRVRHPSCILGLVFSITNAPNARTWRLCDARTTTEVARDGRLAKTRCCCMRACILTTSSCCFVLRAVGEEAQI
jgi:hypothetical protein